MAFGTRDNTRLYKGYIEHGLALVIIPPGQKGPRRKGWQKQENAITTPEQAAQINGHNVGLLHEWSGTCALDLDDLEKARAYLGERDIDVDELLNAPDAVQVSSGRENRAKLIYRLPDGMPPFKTWKFIEGGFELRCAGAQDVLPPSIHPDTQKPYRWIGDWTNIPELPEVLWNLKGTDRSTAPAVAVPAPAQYKIRPDEVVEELKRQELYRQDAGGGKHYLHCPWKDQHTTGDSIGETAYFQPHTGGYERGGFKCLHTHCAERNIQDLLIHLGLDEERLQRPEDILSTRVWTYEDMVADAVYIGENDRVALLSAPHFEMSPQHFHNYTAASKMAVRVQKDNGDVKVANVAVSKVWLAGKDRKDVSGFSFAPGEGVVCRNIEGDLAINTWREPQWLAPEDWKTQVQIFLDHVAFLVQDEEEQHQFLCWLAHMIQHPGDMPPWHVLMYTQGAQGVGRNWVSSCIAQLMPKYCVKHLDISLIAGTEHGTTFNGAIAGKLFACVDELQSNMFNVGGRRMMERLKNSLTAEEVLINPKFQKQRKDRNRMRTLILSNHEDAMPLDREDRRWLVIRNPNQPRSTEYYNQLYGQLKDREFLASVWHYLKTFNLEKMKFGHAPKTEAKEAMFEATEADFVERTREFVDNCEWELVTVQRLKHGTGIEHNWQVRDALRIIRGERFPHKVLLGEYGRHRVVILKNRDRWVRASTNVVRDYLLAHRGAIL